ncbi:MAG: LytTR family DNA-binding domain-containing protein [Pseudomonadota bacterium]
MTTASAPPQARPSRTVARKIVIDLTIMTAIGVILAFIGPFGSFEEPLSYRLVSWVTFAWIGYAIYSPMGPVVDRVSAALDLPRPAIWVVAAAISSLPMTAAVYIMGHLPGPVPWPSVERFFTIYPYVFVIGGGVTALFYMLESRSRAAAPSLHEASPSAPVAPPPADPPAAPQSNPLLEALPAALGSDVIALEMEDHYVRVHTALGSELVLMRLRDAMAHVADVDGRQTHRSWWVARGAVEDVVREGRNVRLVLARGIEAPVSRAQVSELKEAGWF